MPSLVYDKYRLASKALHPCVRSILDVGCRDGVLKKYISSSISYSGMDLFPGPAVTCVGNAEQGLPFPNDEFDAVVALDLLEHADNIWFVFDELLRVAKRQVVILLPNAYHWWFRIEYLRGREMGKYILPAEPIVDRHRWLLSYHAARRFCHDRSLLAGWTVSEVILHGGRRTLPLDLVLSLFSKNLAAWSVMFVLEPNDLH